MKKKENILRIIYKKLVLDINQSLIVSFVTPSLTVLNTLNKKQLVILHSLRFLPTFEHKDES